MALPDTNISTTLVGTTLGSGSRDVGTLCTHPNINKWSRWKPIRSNKVAGLVETDLENAQFGFSFPVEINAGVSILSQNWVYDKPRGLAYNEGYRLGDFRGYNHQAIIPFTISIPDSFLANSNSPSVGVCSIVSTNSDIQLSKLLKNRYLGAMVFIAGSEGTALYRTTDISGFSGSPEKAEISLKDCPLATEGEVLSVYLFTSYSAITEWTSLPYQALESLNAEGDISFRTSVYVTGAPKLNKHIIDVSGINVHGWSETINGYATGTLLTALTKSMEASTVTVTARKNSNNELVYTKVYSAGDNVDPTYIDKYDYNAGDTIGFFVDMPYFPVDQTLPTLTWDDFYNITYTINYI
ncbi:hypothetical protein [Proteiniphilum sp. UBA5463]|jgi:hypothetical protein|uniref:hypothetical protein n=1 Tax=Proteiniphilum sp. UBA5463 TaxID=1947281 RepID=UPI002579EEE7|nr:hypothetical protein [Proteiniphilum sp. UBA5463]